MTSEGKDNMTTENITSMPLGARPWKKMQGKHYVLGAVEKDWQWARGVAKELRKEGISVIIEKEVRIKYKLWCSMDKTPLGRAIKGMFKPEKESKK